MAVRELLLCNGYTGTGYTGNVSDIDEDYRSPDSAFISSPTDGTDLPVRFDFTAPVGLTDDDVIFWLDIKFSLRVSNPEDVDSVQINYFIDGSPVSGASEGLTGLQTFFTQRSYGKVPWDVDFTVAQIGTAQIEMVVNQSGMPIDVDWDLDYINLAYFYGKSSQLDKPLIQRKTYKHLFTR